VPDAERTRHAGADEWDDLFGRIGVYLGVHGVSRKRRVAIHATTTGKAAQLAASSIRQTAR
jgi:hypothetical protein